MASGKTIALTYGTHGAIAVVWVRCRVDAALVQQLKNQAGARWSQTQKCWYLPKEAFSLHEFFERFKKFGFIDYSGLKSKKPAARKREEKGNKPKASKPVSKLNREQAEQVEAFRKWMKQKRYAHNTINTYCHQLEPKLSDLNAVKNRFT